MLGNKSHHFKEVKLSFINLDNFCLSYLWGENWNIKEAGRSNTPASHYTVQVCENVQ